MMPEVSGMINIKRLTDTFCCIVLIDSPSFNERKMADYVKRELINVGADVYEDNAGEYYKGSAGNVYAYLKGSVEGKPILFSAHLDTVEPSKGKRAVVHSDGKITSDGSTVLGADDGAGIAAILEALYKIKEDNIPHRDIELLFPIAEEVYIKGTNVFDFNKLRSKTAYVLDLDGNAGKAAVEAPTLISFEINITGKSSHAGFSPEKGVNAIAAAADGISKIRQGRIDEISTLNIGTILGGAATNIVAGSCIAKGELRSLSHKRALETVENIRNIFENSCEKYNAQLSFNYNIDLTAYSTDSESEAVKRFVKVCNELGISAELISTFGGSDNNNFAKNGIEGIVAACGYKNAHSCNEYITVAELKKTAEMVLKLMTM